MSATPKTKRRAPRRKAALRTPEVEPTAPVELPSEPQPEAEPQTETRPEIRIAASAPKTVEERPRPSKKRAVFIDVENTSRASRVDEALTMLAIDQADAATEIIASGNWRVIGNETARLLAQKGAHLVHSAPATGVRDWSDLRIAVSAGVWLATARAGDRLDIVSDDRAFDAVGDVAAMLGVQYHRHSYRKHGARAEVQEQAAAPARRGRTRGGRGRSRRGQEPKLPAPDAPMTEVAPVEAAASEAPAPVEAAEAPSGPPMAAPAHDLLEVVTEQLQRSPRGVTLDAVANRLKALGYQRPPNSPRLVTRLRQMKELHVNERGFITMKGAAPAAESEASPGSPEEAAPRRRRRRRGPRGPKPE